MSRPDMIVLREKGTTVNMDTARDRFNQWACAHFAAPDAEERRPRYIWQMIKTYGGLFLIIVFVSLLDMLWHLQLMAWIVGGVLFAGMAFSMLKDHANTLVWERADDIRREQCREQMDAAAAAESLAALRVCFANHPAYRDDPGVITLLMKQAAEDISSGEGPLGFEASLIREGLTPQ